MITEEASGPSYSVVRLCQALIAEGKDTRLAALDWAPLNSSPSFLNTFPLGYGPKRLGRSPIMKHWLIEQCNSGNCQIVHNHGLWTMPNIYPGEVVRKKNIPLITAPRGTMSEWAMNQGSRIKRIFWPLVQKPSLDPTTCFHATSEAEYQDIRRHGFRQPVAVVPNGIDLPPLLPVNKPDKMRTLLFLSRVHPVKGLDLLLSAWQVVQNRFPEWQLRIVGSDTGYHGSSGYLHTVQALAKDLQLKRVTFVGELTGIHKLQEYQNAELFVLPTYSENFGIVVAEALAAGVPAIVSKGAPWVGLNNYQAGWWIDIGMEPLVAALEQTLALSPDTLTLMGSQGRKWMEAEYSWTGIAKQMVTVYDWITGKTTSAPSFVYMN